MNSILDRINEGGPDRWGLFNRVHRELERAARNAIGTWRNAAADGISLRSQAHGVAKSGQDDADESLGVAVESAARLLEKAMANPREMLLKVRMAHFLLAEGKVEEARRAIQSLMWDFEPGMPTVTQRESYDYPANYFDL